MEATEMPNEARSDDAGTASGNMAVEPVAGKKTYVVKRGDSLSEIAQREMGDGDRWKELYEANKEAIGDNPDLIHAGTELTIPA